MAIAIAASSNAYFWRYLLVRSVPWLPFSTDETKTRPLLSCFGTFRIEHLLVVLCNAIGFGARAIRNKAVSSLHQDDASCSAQPKRKNSHLDVPFPSLTPSRLAATQTGSESKTRSSWPCPSRSLINMWPGTKRCADGGDQDRSIIRLEGFARDCVSPPHSQQAHWSIRWQLKPSLNRESSSQSDTVCNARKMTPCCGYMASLSPSLSPSP